MTPTVKCITGFNDFVAEKNALVLRSSIFWDVMQRRMVVSYRRLETAHRNYQPTVHNIPEEEQPRLHRGGGL